LTDYELSNSQAEEVNDEVSISFPLVAVDGAVGRVHRRLPRHVDSVRAAQ